jgi:hypothetical protein
LGQYGIGDETARRVVDDGPDSFTNERIEVHWTDSDRVDVPEVRQGPALAQPVDSRCADAKLLGDLGHAQKKVVYLQFRAEP